MASYNADINVNIVGASRLNAVIASVGKLNRIAQDLKPINLLAPGGGDLGDKIRQALKPINDFARGIENGNKRISNTFEGASQQANAFRTVLNNVKISAGGYEKQVASVKLYANALAEAEAQASKLARAQNDLLRTAKGLQEQNIRDAEVIGRRARVTQGRAAQARQREATSNAIIGGAFPLLFGQGAGAAIGGGLGGFAGGAMGGQLGFGLSLVGTAVGQQFDVLTAALLKTGAALRDPIKGFQDLSAAGLLASSNQEKYIQKLIEAGEITKAAAIIQQEIINKIGVDGVKDLQNASAASTKLNKALAELGLQAQAAVAGPLAALLSWLAGIVAIGNNVNRQAAAQTDIIKGLSPTDRTALQKQEQRILQGANIFNEAQKREEVNRLYQTYAGRANIQTPGTAVDLTAQKQAKAQTQELNAQVALAAKQLSLVGLTLEKDGARYIQAAKSVALQEYDNKLLEIKNSWIGKIFNREANLAQIRAANLEYTSKLRSIEAQIAEREYQNTNSRLQQEQALLKIREEALNTIVQYKTAVMGEETGLQTRLQLNKSIENVRRAQLEVEQENAMREAARNGTLETTQRIYAARKALLEMILDLEEKTTRQKYAQLQIDNKINEARKTADFAQQMQGIFAQTPIRRNQLEQLQYEQAQRRASLLNPKYQQQSELRLQLGNETLDPTSDRAKQLQLDLARVTTEIDKMAIALSFVEKQEIVWQKQKAGVDGLNNVLQNSANLLVGAISNGMNAVVQSTDNLSSAFQNLTANLLQAVGQMLIFHSLAQLFGGVLGGGIGNPQGVFSIIGKAFGYGAKDGAYWPGGFQAFADGGMVTRPTMGLIGEGGEPEYVIPASKMRGAMNRYAAGARGSAVIPAGSEGGDGMTATMAAPGAIDVRYTVERINSVDYVTADQFQRGMQQAAAQGAAQGEQRTLRRLQSSNSTRKRLGI